MTDLVKLVALRAVELLDGVWTAAVGPSQASVARHIARLLRARATGLFGSLPQHVAVSLPAAEFDLLADRESAARLTEEVGARLDRDAGASPGRTAPTIVLLPPSQGVAGEQLVCVRVLERTDAILLETQHDSGQPFAVTSSRWALVPAGHRGATVEVATTVYLGRGVSGPGKLEHRSVSKVHARVDVVGGQAVIQDLGSLNGTYVRGDRIAGSVELRDGDEIRIGAWRFTTRIDAAAYAETLKSPDLHGSRP